MEQPTSGSARRRRPAGARRDLILISVLALVAFSVGVTFDVFPRLHDWFERLSPIIADNVLAVLVILAAAFAVVSVRGLQRAEREGELRAETERRFRALVEQVPAVTYTWDQSRGAPLYVSPQIERLAGYSPEEWASSPTFWSERIHSDDRARVVVPSTGIERFDSSSRQEYRLIARDGRIVWVRDESATVATDAQGRPARIQGVIVDITEQKQAEERTQDAENRYRMIVERVPTVAYTWDSADAPGEAPAPYVSPQIERLLGFSAEVWSADPALWEARVHPDDRSPVLEAWERASEREVTFTAEYRLRAADGRWVWIRDEAVPVATGSRGRPIYQGVMIDITEQKRAEERYRQLVEELPVVTYLANGLDPLDHHRLPYMAPGIEQLSGRPASEWMSRPETWWEMVHPDDRERVLAEDRRTERTGDRFEIEYRFVRDDGTVVWVRDSAVLVERHGEWPVWQGFIEDITARRDAEARHREAERRYRHLVERLPAAVYLDEVDDVSTAAYISPQYERLTGYSPEERLADPELWVRMLHPDDRDAVLTESSRTNATGDPFDVEYRIVTKDGRVVWMHDQASLVEDEDGHPCWQGVLTDITERKLAQEALLRRDKILEASGFAAERFLKAPAWTDCVDEVLERAGEAGQASRAYVFRNGTRDDGTITMTQVFEWVAPGIEPTIHLESSSDHPYEEGGFARWRAVLERGDVIHACVRELPASERIWLERQEILSILAVPIFVAGEWWGFIGYDQCEEERDWQPAEIEALTLVANTLGAAVGRERAMRTLSETEARYQTLIETMPAATYIDSVDALSQPIYVSPQMEQMYGYTPEEWRSQPELWEQGLHPDDHDRVVAAVERHNRDGTPYEAEYRYRHRDGRWVWVHDHAVMLRDEQGNLLFSQGVVFDITERREAEEHLRETEERFRAIVEHVPAGIYVDAPDTSMQTMYASPQIEDITGIPADEWTSDPDAWADALHPDDREEVLGHYLAAIAAEEPWSAEYRMRTRHGRTIWVHDETTFVHGEEGRHALLLGVISDITERKLAEQALRESEQRERDAAERLRALDEMKNTFLAAVSHELRSPLTAILGLALTLERSEMVETDRNDLLERLAANARKLDRLLKDLLDIDRLNRGIVDPQYRPTDVGALARRTIESLDALADRSIVVQAEPVLIAIDPAKVERIVENLLMNAARHTQNDRTIWLRVQPDGDGVLIAVEDDGPGVSEELREAIFEPFRQGPASSPHSPGTGIGLSLVGRFAELHGGRAWVEERAGGGASFRVFLPPGPARSGDLPSKSGEALPPDHVSTVGRMEAG
jgi:PAS domain S-box-containing protein